MADHDIIFRYFPQMDAEQRSRIEALDALYREWNARINVISRRDIDNLYTAHILHSLAIAAFLGPLEPGTAFLDMGTGGGLPGIPLAIAYPECSFHLIDRIGKKIRVATEIASALGLRNVTFQHGDIGECRERYDYVVSRAVMTLDALVPLITKNVRREPIRRRTCLPQGGRPLGRDSRHAPPRAGVRPAGVHPRGLLRHQETDLRPL